MWVKVSVLRHLCPPLVTSVPQTRKLWEQPDSSLPSHSHREAPNQFSPGSAEFPHGPRENGVTAPSGERDDGLPVHLPGISNEGLTDSREKGHSNVETRHAVRHSHPLSVFFFYAKETLIYGLTSRMMPYAGQAILPPFIQD